MAAPARYRGLIASSVATRDNSRIMQITRRQFGLLVAGASVGMSAAAESVATEKEQTLYGLIGKIDAVPGKRDELAAILLEGISGMPGCLSYIVARDSADADALWVTEVWDSQDSHKASLSMPSVQEAIGKGRPLITGFSERFETIPIGGQGLPEPG